LLHLKHVSSERYSPEAHMRRVLHEERSS